MSWVHLQHYEDGVEGCYYSLLSSLLLSAFALEAYFNYVGPILEPGWKDFDRAGIWIKLRHVCALSKLPVDTSQGDFQVIKALFDFRNDIAHA